MAIRFRRTQRNRSANDVWGEHLLFLCSELKQRLLIMIFRGLLLHLFKFPLQIVFRVMDAIEKRQDGGTQVCRPGDQLVFGKGVSLLLCGRDQS